MGEVIDMFGKKPLNGSDVRNDGFTDAAALCRSCGRDVADYFNPNNSQAVEFMAYLSEMTGIEPKDLVNVEGGRVWVDPRLLVHIAVWMGPRETAAMACALAEDAYYKV
jgi:hypothetical protein